MTDNILMKMTSGTVAMHPQCWITGRKPWMSAQEYNMQTEEKTNWKHVPSHSLVTFLGTTSLASNRIAQLKYKVNIQTQDVNVWCSYRVHSEQSHRLSTWQDWLDEDLLHLSVNLVSLTTLNIASSCTSIGKINRECLTNVSSNKGSITSGKSDQLLCWFGKLPVECNAAVCLCLVYQAMRVPALLCYTAVLVVCT